MVVTWTSTAHTVAIEEHDGPVVDLEELYRQWERMDDKGAYMSNLEPSAAAALCSLIFDRVPRPPVVPRAVRRARKAAQQSGAPDSA